MKKVTKEYEVFSFDELSKEAKEKALNKYRDNNDYYFLSDDLNERLYELLVEKGITDLNETSKPGTKPTQVQYSLSNCQGDGCMFEGSFQFSTEHEKVGGQWKKYIAHVKHAGHYYHSNSKTMDIVDEDDNEADEVVYTEFNTIYKDICNQLEKDGYAFIDHEDSEECFAELCEANEYTFLSDGTMVNY